MVIPPLLIAPVQNSSLLDVENFTSLTRSPFRKIRAREMVVEAVFSESLVGTSASPLFGITALWMFSARCTRSFSSMWKSTSESVLLDAE